MLRLCFKGINMLEGLSLTWEKSGQTFGKSKRLQWICVHGVHGLELCFGAAKFEWI